MNELEFNYQPIGVIRSEHVEAERTPIQPAYAHDCTGHAEIYPEFTEGLSGIEGFSHLYLIFVFHRCAQKKLSVKPFLLDEEKGVFATRAPCRPNGIGLSIVELIGRQDNLLLLKGVDILDGTPLLDIKPYVGRFDRVLTKKNGWHDLVDESQAQILGRRGFRKVDR